MSSTTGLRAGDPLHEISRLRNLLNRHRSRAGVLERSRDYWRTRARTANGDRKRARDLERSRDYWRTRARAAEWANRTKGAKP